MDISRKSLFITFCLAVMILVLCGAPCLSQSLSNYDLDSERPTYQNLVRNENTALMNTPLQIYRGWYTYGKSYFPFGLKTANFVDTSITAFNNIKKYLDGSAVPGVEGYSKLKEIIGGITDIVILSNKSKVNSVLQFFKKMNAFSDAEDLEKFLLQLDEGKVFEAMADAFKSKFISTTISLYGKFLRPNAIKVYKAIQESALLRRIASMGSIDKWTSRIPIYVEEFGKLVQQTEIGAASMITKAGALIKNPKVVKAGQTATKALNALGHVANVVDGLTRVFTIDECYEDKAFNTVTDGKAIFASIKLVSVLGSYVPGIGAIFKILDAILTLGEMAYSWWAEKHTPLNEAISLIDGSEWEQYKELFDSIWKDEISKNGSIYQTMASTGSTFPVKERNTDFSGEARYEFDADNYTAMKTKEFENLDSYLDRNCSSKHGVKYDGRTPNWPIDKSVYTALAFVSKNMPPDSQMTSDQLKEKEKFIKKIALGGFYQKYLLSGRIDTYLSEGVVEMEKSVPWYDFVFGSDEADKKKAFMTDHTEFKDIHFKLCQQPAYVILSRFDNFRRKYQAELDEKGQTLSNANPMAIFTLGFFYYLFEYERLLEPFKSWDLELVEFANRLRFFFNVCDDIKIHNELIKYGRDEIKKFTESYEEQSIIKSSDISEDKMFRHPNEIWDYANRMLRACSMKIAYELNLSAGSGRINMDQSYCDSKINEWEESAIKELYSNSDAIGPCLTYPEADDTFTGGYTLKYKGLDLAPVPKDFQVNVPNTIHGYIREYFIVAQLFANTIAAYDMVFLNRKAIIQVANNMAERFIRDGGGDGLKGTNADIYNSKVLPIMKDYINKSRISMDEEDESELIGKYKEATKSGSNQFIYGICDSKMQEGIDRMMVWYHAIRPKLFQRIKDINANGKVFNIFIYVVHEDLRKLTAYKTAIANSGYWETVGDTFGHWGEIGKGYIFNSLKKKLDCDDEQLEWRSDAYCGADFNDTRYVSTSYHAPVFLIIEKEEEKYYINAVR